MSEQNRPTFQELETITQIVLTMDAARALLQESHAVPPQIDYDMDGGAAYVVSADAFDMLRRLAHTRHVMQCRAELVRDLTEAGFECRPIVAGNFAKNEVMAHFDYEVHGTLKNADYIDQHGLFVGNHHYPIPEAVEALSRL